jgi:hypothetical protein
MRWAQHALRGKSAKSVIITKDLACMQEQEQESVRTLVVACAHADRGQHACACILNCILRPHASSFICLSFAWIRDSEGLDSNQLSISIVRTQFYLQWPVHIWWKQPRHDLHGTLSRTPTNKPMSHGPANASLLRRVIQPAHTYYMYTKAITVFFSCSWKFCA